MFLKKGLIRDRYWNGKICMMTKNDDWTEDCQAEINQAKRARAVGNEGMARVCARRAAGIVIREYYRRRDENPPEKSAIKLLQVLSQDLGQPVEIRTAAKNFTLAITHDHVLPIDVDLIDSVNWLAQAMLGEVGIE